MKLWNMDELCTGDNAAYRNGRSKKYFFYYDEGSDRLATDHVNHEGDFYYNKRLSNNLRE